MFNKIKEYQKHRENMKDPEYAKEFKEKQRAYLIGEWNKLGKFVHENDVPRLPEMNDFFIGKLIDCGAIPKNKLEDGIWYYGNYRNSTLGKWDEKNQKFGLWRYKFGFYWDNCNHFEDDNGYALFVPLRIANEKELEQIKKIEDEKLR